MKKAIILLLFLAIAYTMSAQAQRRDTVVLSVYNNNQRFMLYPMPFGTGCPWVESMNSIFFLMSANSRLSRRYSPDLRSYS